MIAVEIFFAIIFGFTLAYAATFQILKCDVFEEDILGGPASRHAFFLIGSLVAIMWMALMAYEIYAMINSNLHPNSAQEVASALDSVLYSDGWYYEVEIISFHDVAFWFGTSLFAFHQIACRCLALAEIDIELGS